MPWTWRRNSSSRIRLRSASLKDTDVAAASVAMTQQQASYQAAIQAEAAMPKTSLFSYLSGN